jgi:RNA-binding protein
LQEAGTVLHLARSGRFILKASSNVREGSTLVDEKGRRTGRVLEIIGPASSPYLSCQPFTDRIERVVGTKLFIEEEVPKRLSSSSRKFGRRPGGEKRFDRGRSVPVHKKPYENRAERKIGSGQRR